MDTHFGGSGASVQRIGFGVIRLGRAASQGRNHRQSKEQPHFSIIGETDLRNGKVTLRGEPFDRQRESDMIYAGYVEVLVASGPDAPKGSDALAGE
jgi:hypothetical protein